MWTGSGVRLSCSHLVMLGEKGAALYVRSCRDVKRTLAYTTSCRPYMSTATRLCVRM